MGDPIDHLQHAAGNERVIEGQKRALELAVHGAPLGAVLDALVRTIEAQSTNDVIGSILLLDSDRKHLREGAAPSLPAPYNAAIDGIEIGPTVGSCGTAAFHGRTIVVSDIASDPLWASFKTLALAHGLRACWSTPIFSSRDEVLGTFALYHRRPMEPSQRDREIVELLGHTAGLVIERDRNARAREEAHAALRTHIEQQMQRIGSLFERAPVAIAVLRGPEHVFEIANAAYARLVGGRDVTGKRLHDALPELEGQGFRELLDTVRRTGQPYTGHAQPVKLEHAEVYCDFVYQPVMGPDGATESILVVAYEVTALVRAQQDLRTFIDHLPALAWTAPADGRIDFFNRRWLEYTGTTADDMARDGWASLQDPAARPAIQARWQHSLATGEPFEMEMTLRGADGVARWFLTRMSATRDERGAIVRWFGTSTDVDEIKAARALTDAMAEQSLDVQRMLLELRAAKDEAEHRLAALEHERRHGSAGRG